MVRWLHNGHEIKGQTSFSLQKSHADVFSSGNYSCVPFNQVNETKQFISTYIKITQKIPRSPNSYGIFFLVVSEVGVSFIK